jgi:glycerophosphoryl diester phosphodiesterase
MVGTGSFRQGAQSPFAVALRNWEPEKPLATADETARPDVPAIGERVVEVVQTRLAVPAPEPDDLIYPYCRRDEEGAADGLRPRNVIILILESIGMRELELPAMKNLRAIAADGTSFERFFASGAQSSQGTVSIFSGIPAATHRQLLLRTPLRRLDGFANDLRSRGFRTAYFHGSDLSFEQQRTYLHAVGFEELYEPDLAKDDRIGWGLPDGVMLDRLRSWLEEDEAPALAALFSVSTHDPYELPASAPTAKGSDPWSKFKASLEYLDEELGRFYRWYVEHEYPKGTLLFITGDHMPRLPHPGDPPQTSTGELEYRFRVPLIAVGRGIEREVRSELGGHLDVGSTVLGSLGWDRHGCYQGRNLLGDPATGRWIPSVAGELMNFLFIHDGDERWTVDFKEGTLRRFNWRNDPHFERALPNAAASDRASKVRRFAEAYLQLGGYLNGLDRYVAPSVVAAVKPQQRKAVRPSKSPIVVSHRGNTLGPDHPDAPRENTQAAIQAAIDAGMEWVEIDMQVTREGVVVLAHDPVIDGEPIASMSLAELRARDPSASTLEEVLRRFGPQVGFCLEIKPQQFLDKLSIVQGVIKLLPLAKRGAIVDSFSRAAVEAMERHSEAETGFDLPHRAPRDEWLVYASERGFDWVYVRHDFITPAFADRAHELGLKVMAYTINDGTKPPNVDGIITDVARP